MKRNANGFPSKRKNFNGRCFFHIASIPLRRNGVRKLGNHPFVDFIPFSFVWQSYRPNSVQTHYTKLTLQSVVCRQCSNTVQTRLSLNIYISKFPLFRLNVKTFRNFIVWTNFAIGRNQLSKFKPNWHLQNSKQKIQQP